MVSEPLKHLLEVLGYHPQYLQSFLDTHRYLMYGNGPLSYDYRHYIAIMASARAGCAYLANAESILFLLQGGEPSWLLGLQHIPRKLRNLCEINKILAHTPWLLKSSHVMDLTKSGCEETWSLSELMHALVLLAHFHALSSFVQGCSITDDADDEGNSPVETDYRSPLDGTPLSCDNGARLSVDELIFEMKMLTIASVDTTCPEDIAERIDKLNAISVELVESFKQRTSQDLNRYIEDPEYVYQDFTSTNTNGKREKIHTFIDQDFSWEDQGYSLASRLYMEIGVFLDDKFNIAQNFTYYADKEAEESDTVEFRRAVWNFVHCLYGLRHCDYDYSLPSSVLKKNLRSYIKVVSCHPDVLSHAGYSDLTTDFALPQKVHMNVMIMESRMQAELLYALRAVFKHVHT